MLNLTLKQFAACLLVDGPINVESSSSTSSRSSEVPVDTSNTSGALYVPDEGNVQYVINPQLHLTNYYYFLPSY